MHRFSTSPSNLTIEGMQSQATNDGAIREEVIAVGVSNMGQDVPKEITQLDVGFKGKVGCTSGTANDIPTAAPEGILKASVLGTVSNSKDVRGCVITEEVIDIVDSISPVDIGKGMADVAGCTQSTSIDDVGHLGGGFKAHVETVEMVHTHNSFDSLAGLDEDVLVSDEAAEAVEHDAISQNWNTLMSSIKHFKGRKASSVGDFPVGDADRVQEVVFLDDSQVQFPSKGCSPEFELFCNKLRNKKKRKVFLKKNVRFSKPKAKANKYADLEVFEEDDEDDFHIDSLMSDFDKYEHISESLYVDSSTPLRRGKRTKKPVSRFNY